MANNLPIKEGNNSRTNNKHFLLKKIKKATKKAFKNLYIIIKALGVLSLRGLKKTKSLLIALFEKVKSAKIGLKLKKALVVLIKIFIVIYCVCAEGALWVSRILGPKIKNNKALYSFILKIKSKLPNRVKIKFFNNLIAKGKTGFEKLSIKLNSINFIKNLILVIKAVVNKVMLKFNITLVNKPQHQPKTLMQHQEIKEKLPATNGFKPFTKRVYAYSCEYFVAFRKRAKTFFKNPKHNFKVLVEKIRVFNKHHNNILIPISVVSVCLVIGIYVVSFYTIGLNVYVGKDIMAVASSQQKFEKFVDDFDNKLSTELNEKYETKHNFYYEFSLVQKSKLDKFDDFEIYLIKNNHEIQQMYVIKVNDKVIGANLDESKLKQVLENFKMRYSSGVSGERLEFVENVVVEKQFCKVDNYKSISEIENTLLSTKTKAVADHVVKQGETLSEIASSYNMRTSELLALNPNISEKKLQVGTALAVSKDKPLISIRTIKPMTYNQAVAYGTQTEPDDSMYKNQTKVKSSGVLGEETVKADVVLVDGQEVDRLVIERQTIKEPVDQVLLKGTKALPPTAPTGTFRMPTSGYISSRFGYRGGEYHTGLDIAAPTGTPVYAADGGRVIFAGWSGSYGYLIEIDHGNGYQTWYAHLSAMSVSVGTSVAKGTRIGSVGATGRSTGSHLHIEVRKNGAPVNPQNYLS